MADLVFTTRGVAQVLADQERLSQQLGRQRTAARELNAQYTANEAELRRLGRTAQQIYLANETAQEKYNRKLAEARAALRGNVNETELLTREQRRLQQELDSSGNSFLKAFSPGKLASAVTGFVSISAAVSLITKELQAQQQMIDKRNASQLSVGESRNVLLRNLVGSPKGEINAALSAGGNIAQSTGMSEVPINNALASAISATGNVPLSIELVRRSAQFLKDRPSEIGDYAGALGDLTRVTHSSDPNVSLGLVATIGKLSRPISPQQTAQSLAPAMLGTLPFGGSAQSAGALYASLTTGSGDFSGLHSSTGVIALAQQLQEASLGKGTFAPTATHPGFAVGELGGGDLMGRIRFLQKNPAIAQKFLDMSSFERKVIGPITQLLTDPASQMAGDFTRAANEIGSNAQLAATGRSATEIFGYNSLNPVAERGRTLSRALEGLQTRRGSDKLDSQELESLRGIAMETGSTSLGASLDEMIARAKGGGIVSASDAINQLEAQANRLENPYVSYSAGEPGTSTSYPREATPEEKESAKLLRDAVQKLQDSLKEQQETNRILRRQNTSRAIPIGAG